MPESFHPARMVLALACAGLASRGASAQQDTVYSLDAGTERAALRWDVRDATWWSSRVQLDARRSDGSGWFVGAESQKRDRDTDTGLAAGMYGRAGPWVWSGQVAAAPGSRFLPRYSVEPQLGYQVGRTVFEGGLVYRSFPESTVRIGTVGLVHYVGDSELGLRFAMGRSQPGARDVRVVTVRGLLDRGGPWTFGATASAGKGLYDILNVPGVSGNRGWSASVNARYRIDPRHSIRFELGAGRERPSFRETRVGLSFRKTF